MAYSDFWGYDPDSWDDYTMVDIGGPTGGGSMGGYGPGNAGAVQYPTIGPGGMPTFTVDVYGNPIGPGGVGMPGGATYIQKPNPNRQNDPGWWGGPTIHGGPTTPQLTQPNRPGDPLEPPTKFSVTGTGIADIPTKPNELPTQLDLPDDPTKPRTTKAPPGSTYQGPVFSVTGTGIADIPTKPNDLPTQLDLPDDPTKSNKTKAPPGSTYTGPVFTATGTGIADIPTKPSELPKTLEQPKKPHTPKAPVGLFHNWDLRGPGKKKPPADEPLPPVLPPPPPNNEPSGSGGRVMLQSNDQDAPLSASGKGMFDDSGDPFKKLDQRSPWNLSDFGAPDVGPARRAELPGLVGNPQPIKPFQYNRSSLVTEPTYATLGEDGPEAVIPLNNRRGNRLQSSLIGYGG